MIIFRLTSKSFDVVEHSNATPLKSASKQNVQKAKYVENEIKLMHSDTVHRFRIKKMNSTLYKIFKERNNEIYLATDVIYKGLLNNKSFDLQIIFHNTYRTTYRKLEYNIFDYYFNPMRDHPECDNPRVA